MAEEIGYEKFEYDNIKLKLIELKEKYTNYVKAINNIDMILKTELNISANSALFNSQGTKITSLWDNYCYKTKNFLYIFEKWTDSITKVYNNNLAFETGTKDNMVLEDIDLEIIPPSYSNISYFSHHFHKTHHSSTHSQFSRTHISFTLKIPGILKIPGTRHNQTQAIIWHSNLSSK